MQKRSRPEVYEWRSGVNYYIWSVNCQAWLFNCCATEAQAMRNAKELKARYPKDTFRIAREWQDGTREFCWIA